MYRAGHTGKDHLGMIEGLGHLKIKEGAETKERLPHRATKAGRATKAFMCRRRTVQVQTRRSVDRVQINTNLRAIALSTAPRQMPGVLRKMNIGEQWKTNATSVLWGDRVHRHLA